MDAEEKAFLRRICETPADDVVRLVFADWLDEHGQHDRAAFIRIQIQIHNMVEPWTPMSPECFLCRATRMGSPSHNQVCVCTKDFMELRRRELELNDLLYPNRNQAEDIYAKGRKNWRRGFVYCYAGSLADFANEDFIRGVFEIHPITQVRFIGLRPSNLRRRSRGKRTFTWFREGEFSGNGANIPAKLMPVDENRRRANFPTEEAALVALSDKCVSWARNLAGLPPLQRPEKSPTRGSE